MITDFYMNISSADAHQLRPPTDTVHMQAWWDFAKTHSEEWAGLVAQVFFSESCLDPCDASTQDCTVKLFPSAFCEIASFPSEKSSWAHMRAKHRHRCDARRYAGGFTSTTCWCCRTRFSVRARLVARMTDRRRSRCLEQVMSNCIPLEDSVLADLDEIVRNATQMRVGKVIHSPK